jgi:hypothetical protein
MFTLGRVAASLAVGFLVAASAGKARAQCAAEADAAKLITDAVPAGQAGVPRWLAETVIRAAEVTGADPAYMLALADKESTFNHQAKAKTSSAAGLFQFLEGTWLRALNAYGAKHGFGAAAEAITVVQGRLVVSAPANKPWIMSLREDPYLSALMAGEMINRSRELLSKQCERRLTNGDLYLAHFLGDGGASRLLKLVEERPEERAPMAFPAAAKANRTIFYSGASKTRKDATVLEVQTRINTMIEKCVGRYAALVDRDLAPTQVSSLDAH